MSGTTISGTTTSDTTTSGTAISATAISGGAMSCASKAGADDGERWAAFDKRNERLVDPSHPLLVELRRDQPDIGRSLQAAS